VKLGYINNNEIIRMPFNQRLTTGKQDTQTQIAYKSKGCDALRMGSKGRHDSCVGGRQKLHDPLVTHGPYSSALECYVSSHMARLVTHEIQRNIQPIIIHMQALIQLYSISENYLTTMAP